MTKILIIVVTLVLVATGAFFAFSPFAKNLFSPSKESAFNQQFTYEKPTSSPITPTPTPLATSDQDIDSDLTTLDGDLSELNTGNSDYNKELLGI